MVLGAQFLAALRHGLKARAQPIAFDQRQAQRHDSGKGQQPHQHRGEEGLVEQDIHDTDAEHGPYLTF